MDKKRFIIILFVILLFVVSIILSLYYYKGKNTVSFETGSTDGILTKYVEKNKKIEEPNTPIKEGYVFIEWQLNGQTFDFDTEINEDIVLTAKWMKEEYVTVSYISNAEIELEKEIILKGSALEELPSISKDGYTFAGWYNGDKLYNNEEINSDITLEAKFEIIEEKLKIGDEVYIIGNYAESAYSESADYTAALNWNRYILDILEDSNYPYVVGNETGVTGFFKKESLELVK